jgi:Tol biopolymer transport system component
MVMLLILTACSFYQKGPMLFRDLAGVKVLFRQNQPMQAFGGVYWTNQEKIAMEDGIFLHMNLWIGDPITGRVDPVILDGKQEQGCNPIISPDGQYLAYSMHINSSCKGSVQIVSLAPSIARKQLLNFANASALAWSADSSRLALMMIEDDQYSIYFYTISTASLDLIYRFPREGRAYDFGITDNMAWSSDGNYLAFSLGQPTNQGRSDVYVFSIAEKTLLRVTNDPALSEGYPSWSPENVLMYVAASDPYSQVLNGQIILYDVHRKCKRVITTAEKIANPQWFPNGKEIAFVANAERGTNIYSLPVTSLGIDVTNPDAICSPSPTATK